MDTSSIILGLAKKNMSWGDLAEDLEVGVDTIDDWISSEHIPTKVLNRMADLLNIDCRPKVDKNKLCAMVLFLLLFLAR